MKTPKDAKTAASPIIIMITPESIGLRTREYGPDTTIFLVGAHGASVPLPIFANSSIVHTARNNPAKKIRAPKTIGSAPLENDRLSVKNNIINGIVTVALNGSVIIAFNHCNFIVHLAQVSILML